MLTQNDTRDLRCAIKKLVGLWVKFGRNSELFFSEQEDSLYFDEYTILSEMQIHGEGSDVDWTFMLGNLMNQDNSLLGSDITNEKDKSQSILTAD